MQLQLRVKFLVHLLILTEVFASVTPDSLVFCTLQFTTLSCVQWDRIVVMYSGVWHYANTYAKKYYTYFFLRY